MSNRPEHWRDASGTQCGAAPNTFLMAASADEILQFRAPRSALRASKDSEVVARFVGHAVGSPRRSHHQLDLRFINAFELLQRHLRLLDDLRARGAGGAR